MNKSEHIPTEIFDLLENLPFSKLNEEQQQTVLAHFTQSDYDDMHFAAKTLKGLSHNFLINDTEVSKTNLALHFEKHHHQAKIIHLPSRYLVLWQSAAVVLFLLSGWLFYKLFDFKTQDVSTKMAKVDTVYVDRETQNPAAVTHDTVIMYKYLIAGEKLVNSTPSKTVEARLDPVLTLTNEEIQVMNLDELNTPQNKPRRRSMKDDSLLQHYGFIAM